MSFPRTTGGALGWGRSGHRVVLMEEDYTSSSAAALRTPASAPMRGRSASLEGGPARAVTMGWVSPGSLPRAPGALLTRAPLTRARRGRFRRVDYALRKMRTSRLLRWTAVLAFLCWGGLLGLAIFGRMTPLQGGQLALLSLGAWCFLLWWFPILERTIAYTTRLPGKAWIGHTLEWVAIGGTAFVHLLMAIMIVFIARS